MNVHQYRFLLSERATLKELIADAPADSIITRMSLERRLEEVTDELSEYPDSLSPRLITARLTFSGKPVAVNHGILARFGVDVVKAFEKAIASAGASLSAPLAARGPVPHREACQLLITNVVRGSFGFEVEGASQRASLMSRAAPVESAMEQVKNILEASVKTDDDLADTIADIDGRAIRDVREFLKIVADNSAVCALEFKGDVFQFRDTDQVRRSEGRLRRDNIHEEDIALAGHFRGFLPTSRRAEFQVEDGEIITGRVDSALENADEINGILNQLVRITVHTKRVGSGRPQYVIRNYAEAL